MGTLITIWLVAMGIYYLCVATMRLAIKLPAIVIFVLTLPAMPFIVAYRNRVEHPIQAKVLCWMYGVLIALITLIIIVDGHL